MEYSDLKCCVSFRCTKWLSYIYTCIHSFLDSIGTAEGILLCLVLRLFFSDGSLEALFLFEGQRITNSPLWYQWGEWAAPTGCQDPGLAMTQQFLWVKKISQGFNVPPAHFFFFFCRWGSITVRVVKCGKSQSLRRVQQVIKKSASDALVVIDPLGATEGRLQEVHCASLCDRTVIKVVFKVFSCTHLDQAGRLTG